jgi:CAAX prenyl protease-like protein
MRLAERYPSLPYVTPFLVFMAFLAVGPRLPIGAREEAILRIGVLSAVLWFCSRSVISLRPTHALTSVALGIAVFAIWIAPDMLLPAWRDSFLFNNGLTGRVEGSLAPEARADRIIVMLRFARAVILVPIIEELFWRAWLPRWVDRMEDFREVPLGQYSRAAFLLTAVLFASEHGSLWDVGLVAGLLYNWWMSRTRSLGDLILAHAVTNACLSIYVVMEGRWEYW